MHFILGGLFFIGIIGYAVAQMIAGYLGIEYHFSSGWAIAAIIISLLFRFTLPITIGAFFGAMDVWGWHWSLAAIFAVPGLIFIVPSVLMTLLAFTPIGKRQVTTQQDYIDAEYEEVSESKDRTIRNNQ